MNMTVQDDEPKFTRPSQSSLYRPEIALEFFRSVGKAERVDKGKPVFVEAERSGGVFAAGNHMFLMLDGEVMLSVKGKPIALVGKGEIFGEMASISQLPRSATAMAKTDCSLISLDEKQFQSAVEKSPEFALMLMNIIIGRILETISNLTSGGRLSGSDKWNRAMVFDKKLIADLRRETDDKPAVFHPVNKEIMKEGDKGIFMYVVEDGVVAISIGGRVLEKVGPGGVFGEMALVKESPRAATATTESDCTLLAINRADFLNLVRTKPAFAMSLLRALSERLRFMTSKYKQ